MGRLQQSPDYAAECALKPTSFALYSMGYGYTKSVA